MKEVGFTNVPIAAEMSQGAMAVYSGDAHDVQVASLLANEGLFLDEAKSLESLQSNGAGLLFGKGFFCLDCLVAHCTFGRPLKPSVVVWRREWPSPLAIQMRTQAISGSVDGKLQKVVNDLVECCPIPSAILITGRHFETDQGIHNWLQKAKGRSEGKILNVWIGDASFRRWVVEGMPWPGDSQKTFA